MNSGDISGTAAAFGLCLGLGVVVVGLTMAYAVMKKPAVRDLNKELWERVLKL